MSLDKRKKEMELKRVEMARMELELKIDEKIEEINRLKLMIDIQQKKEQELTAEITAFNKEGN